MMVYNLLMRIGKRLGFFLLFSLYDEPRALSRLQVGFKLCNSWDDFIIF